MKIIAAIPEFSAIAKILDRLGLFTRAPPRSPARGSDVIDLSDSKSLSVFFGSLQY